MTETGDGLKMMQQILMRVPVNKEVIIEEWYNEPATIRKRLSLKKPYPSAIMFLALWPFEEKLRALNIFIGVLGQLLHPPNQNEEIDKAVVEITVLLVNHVMKNTGSEDGTDRQESMKVESTMARDLEKAIRISPEIVKYVEVRNFAQSVVDILSNRSNEKPEETLTKLRENIKNLLGKLKQRRNILSLASSELTWRIRQIKIREHSGLIQKLLRWFQRLFHRRTEDFHVSYGDDLKRKAKRIAMEEKFNGVLSHLVN